MVSNLGCAPDAVPQWESGRIAFKDFYFFIFLVPYFGTYGLYICIT